jgi:hypothetical protein
VQKKITFLTLSWAPGTPLKLESLKLNFNINQERGARYSTPDSHS